jgi:predicted secreted protein
MVYAQPWDEHSAPADQFTVLVNVSETPVTPPIELTEKDNGSVITVEAGNIITIKLRGNPSTGYSWKLVDEYGESLELIGVDYESDPHAGGMVGTPGTYIYRFKALASGATTLKMVYARPWDEHSAPAGQFTVFVNVSETPVDSLPETPGFPWRWHPGQRFLRRMLNQATDQDSRGTLVVGPEHDVVIDQAIVEAQPWWDAAARAVETLTPSVETYNDSSMAHIRADGATSGQSGSAGGSARIDVLGYDAGAYADGDWTDGNVGVGAQANANLLRAVASGQFETVAKVGDVEIVSNGDGSTSYIVGAHVSADATLGIDGLELSTTAIVGATLTAEGTANTDIGGLTAGVEGEAMIHVGAQADATLGLNVEGLQFEALAFAGDRFHASGGAEMGGMGVEATAEAWAGPLRNNFGVLRFPPDGSHWTGPGGITTGQLLGHTEDPENRWSGRSVAGQLSPRWDKPSGSGMRQEVFRASIAEMESRQLAELIFDSSLKVWCRLAMLPLPHRTGIFHK